ncbi:rod shape-determining protein MreC [Iocasia frigidifontis]|uniref:Cell shape-determining protein MreC n=1 Tax=Iocasia fonsfrigidae TaxID=2682810 RepID=A0A8A7KED6_9FIRM|nr:rod shape-determining protein MreC [Iocasia fonsfrigidae]QTL97257.1 rod shape-determining protein MreC [Iocasia fonsfrigidae]
MRYFGGSTLIISLVVVIIIVGLGFLSFSDIDIPLFNWLERGIFNIISPVLNIFTGFCDLVSNYWRGITNVNDLIEENQELKKELSELKLKQEMTNYLVNQNERLRDLLSFKEFVPYDTLGARVIGYSTSHWKKSIIINRGEKDGLELRMPVLSYDGILVGRINHLAANSAQVLLISDSEFVVGGIVQRSDSRAVGIVKREVDPTRNIMENIPWNNKSPEGDILKGDIIVSSGLSNSYPKGLPIGTVVEVEEDNYGLSQKAVIDIFLDTKTLEEVLVITNF